MTKMLYQKQITLIALAALFAGQPVIANQEAANPTPSEEIHHQVSINIETPLVQVQAQPSDDVAIEVAPAQPAAQIQQNPAQQGQLDHGAVSTLTGMVTAGIIDGALGQPIIDGPADLIAGIWLFYALSSAGLYLHDKFSPPQQPLAGHKYGWERIKMRSGCPSMATMILAPLIVYFETKNEYLSMATIPAEVLIFVALMYCCCRNGNR